VVFKFPGIANFRGSVVISILPAGWLFVVVLGSVGFVGGVGEVVNVVEFVVDVGGGFVGEVFNNFGDHFSLVGCPSIFEG